tara:strand:- start:4373 stop:4672 length:300 start_codon:yes stop_codon:yes gene_type:complete
MTTLEEKAEAILINEPYGISARVLSFELNMTFEATRRLVKKLVRKGLATSQVRREFERPRRAPNQGQMFGGATMCVRRRAYYTAKCHDNESWADNPYAP